MSGMVGHRRSIARGVQSSGFKRRLPMTSKDRITLYYSPQTGATGARVLLEELGAPYDLHVLNMKAGEQRQPAYLAVNPAGQGAPASPRRGAGDRTGGDLRLSRRPVSGSRADAGARRSLPRSVSALDRL